MADIHDLGLGSDTENCPFNSAHKMVIQSEVGCECDDRTLRQVSLLNNGVWTDSKVMVQCRSVKVQRSLAGAYLSDLPVDSTRAPLILTDNPKQSDDGGAEHDCSKQEPFRDRKTNQRQ